jgi:DNA polymerase III sliding clamp (beta) subunit (PCNA family)
MDIEGQRLVQTLGSLSCFISDNFNNIMMTGYSFDGKAKRIVALDSHRIGLRRMENDFMTDKKIVVPGVVYSQLKKISTAKSGNIQVLANDKHVEFIGEDFKLYSRLIAGEYFNIDTMLDTFYDYQLVIDPKELYKLCKEYYGVAKSAKAPMYFTYNKEHNLVRTGISTSDYITVDELETVDKNKSTGLNKDFIYGFNPLYIYEAMQLFDGEVKCCGVLKTGSFRNVICPIVFDDDEYLAFVLPVNIASELTDKFIEYLNAA